MKQLYSYLKLSSFENSVDIDGKLRNKQAEYSLISNTSRLRAEKVTRYTWSDCRIIKMADVAAWSPLNRQTERGGGGRHTFKHDHQSSTVKTRRVQRKYIDTS